MFGGVFGDVSNWKRGRRIIVTFAVAAELTSLLRGSPSQKYGTANSPGASIDAAPRVRKVVRNDKFGVGAILGQ